MAVSSQEMQDHFGAKFADWLAGWLCGLVTSFQISLTQGGHDPGTRLKLLATGGRQILPFIRVF